MMLNDAAVELVREAGGDALLLDARNRRCIVSDTAQLEDILKRLRNAGFSRMIDFTAQHLSAVGKKQEVGRPSLAADEVTAGTEARRTDGDSDEFALFLTLRHPGHGHDELTLKWKWRTTAQGEPAAEPPAGNGNGVDPDEVDTGYNVNGGAGRSGGHPRRTGPVLHPSLSRIWPAAGLAEREIFEMLGIAFSGNENLKPLLIGEAFLGNPLRNDFETKPKETYAKRLLRKRHEQGLLDALNREEGSR